MIEPLESRIAPATLTFTDIDGDKVVITTSGPGALTAGVNVLFDGTGHQLQTLDLRGAAFHGANVSIVATRAGGGNGLVHVGYINATGRDLGAVLVDGDLAALDAGDGTNPASACKGLTVGSLGRFGLSTQGGAGDLISNFDGRLDKLVVKTDVKEAFVSVTDSAGANGKIGAVFVGGSLIGGFDNNSGGIFAEDGVGAATIKGDIVGGAGTTSGALTAVGNMGAITVGGSVLGGPGATSGVIFSSQGSLGAVKIGGDIAGGGAINSGRIFAKTMLTSLTVGGSITGSNAADSGKVHSDGAIGLVSVRGSITDGGVLLAQTSLGAVMLGGSLHGTISCALGAAGPVKIGGDVADGTVFAKTVLKSVNIGGSFSGSSGGNIQSDGDAGPIRIGGSIVGGEGNQSVRIFVGGTLTSLVIGGSIIGNGSNSARVIADDLGSVAIGRDIIGSGEGGSARISVSGTLGNVTLGGSLIAGSNSQSGQIKSGGAMGHVKILGDVFGTGGMGSGSINSGGTLASVTVAGSVIGGDINEHGGEIASVGNMGNVKIGRDLRGGDEDHTGLIKSGGRIGDIFIGGSVVAGASTSGPLVNSGAIRAADEIGHITIRGSLVGRENVGLTLAMITARGQGGILPPTLKTDLAIKSITIGGRVELAQVLAGWDTSDIPVAVNGNASIGPVRIGGDWFASSLVAGVQDDSDAALDAGFGDGNDNLIAGFGADALIARIASITIGGAVSGAPNPFFQTGFVAQQIGAFKAAGFTAALTGGTDLPILVTPYTANVTVREV